MSPEEQERFDHAARRLDEDLVKEKADAMPAKITDGAFPYPEYMYEDEGEHFYSACAWHRQWYPVDYTDPNGCYTPEQARAAMQAAQKRP